MDNFTPMFEKKPKNVSIYTLIPDQPPIELIAYYDEFKSYYPNCEMATKRWFVQNVDKDWVMLDCGANIGYFSILFARLAPEGYVYAFEPTSTYDMLLKNLAHNRVENVIPVRLAVGKQSVQMEDAVFRIWGGNPERQIYSFTTIDDFVRENDFIRLDCIKIDVDSFDFEVLQGAKKTLLEYNPFVMVELNYALNQRNQSNMQALDWLCCLGYKECVVLDYDNFLFKRGLQSGKEKGHLPQMVISFDQAKNLDLAKIDEKSLQLEFPQEKTVKQRCTSKAILTEPEQKGSIDIPIVSVQDLHKELEFEIPVNYPETSLIKPLNKWRMEIDDSPIFRYIYRNFRPKRHLEFGTWQGTGTLYCLKECDATVWTINPMGGENKSDGSPTYSLYPSELPATRAWAKKIGLPEKDTYRTDSIGFIGRFYLEKEMGHRVCQIYCDSRKWDISNYPPDFFDSVLIDGGHTKDIVINDTQKAFQLLRQGGIIMWHDFCPPVFDQFETTLGVMKAISQEWDWLHSQTKQLFWIAPSWILLGEKR